MPCPYFANLCAFESNFNRETVIDTISPNLLQ
jgi:hypothetical protein